MFTTENQNGQQDNHSTESPKNQRGSDFLEKLKSFMRDVKAIFLLHDNTDVEATMASIHKSVEFRGINVWLLGFAVIIASVGLNVNSTAVIIGAMLISPLMGPINGVGLAVGTYDMELLRRSIRNLLLMVGISLVASTLYFLLSPLGEAQSELLARTRPTIFDVIIATFGGLAGIVAASRKDLPFTVVSGVAIATALMPPLCTAGYGIATWQLSYAFGAFYLFFINSFFIALATFVMVRYLHFPQHKFVDARHEKLVKRVVIVLAILVVIPSFFTAVNVVRESVFNSRVNKFVSDIRAGKHLDANRQLVNVEKSFASSKSTVTLTIVGDEIPYALTDSLQTIMEDDYGLSNAKLKIKQMGSSFNPVLQAGQLGKMISERDETIKKKDQEIAALSGDAENNKTISQRVGDRYAESIVSIAVSNLSDYQTKNKNNSSYSAVVVTWKDDADRETVQEKLQDDVALMLDVPLNKVRILSTN